MADILLRPDSPPPHPGDSRASLDYGSKVDLAVADGSDAAAALAYAPLLYEEARGERATSPEASLGVPPPGRDDGGSSPASSPAPSSPEESLARANGLHNASGARFYGRVRLVMAEELVHRGTTDKAVARRKQIALSRRGQSLAKSASQGPLRNAKQTTRGRRPRQQQREPPGSSGNRRGDTTGAHDTYDAYPWSSYFRDEVMCLSKIPRPPYFRQLNPGLRPDTVVLRTVPVSWFLDTPEEVAEEREREIRERKVARYGDTEESNEPTSDSPLWFTKHGKILIKAACMRFGPVRRVDLVFEMESRNEEWTLMFDAYVQFSTFAGFRDAYIAFDGGVLLHANVGDKSSASGNLQCLELEPEFDTTGYFSDKNCKLRKVRRELAQRKEEQEAHARAVQLRRQKKAYLEGLEKVQKAVKLMKNDFEDLEYELDRLLQMSKVDALGSAAMASTREREDAGFVEGAGRARECRDRVFDYVACMPAVMPNRESDAHGVMAALVAAGRGEKKDAPSGGGRENPEEDDKDEAKYGEQKAAAAADGGDEFSPDGGESKAGSPCADAGKHAATRLISTLTGSEIVYEARKRLSEAKKAIKHASSAVFKAYTARTVQVPSLMQVLESRMGTHSRLAELVHRRIRMHGEEYFHGVTLFVPHDRGFGTDTFFDEDCWGTHLLRGPYLARDLYGFASEGMGELFCANGIHHLSAGMNERGEFTVWIERRGHPRRVVRVEEPDVCVQNGSIVHFVDKVIFPPSY